jgi:hypothetical protein
MMPGAGGLLLWPLLEGQSAWLLLLLLLLLLLAWRA